MDGWMGQVFFSPHIFTCWPLHVPRLGNRCFGDHVKYQHQSLDTATKRASKKHAVNAVVFFILWSKTPGWCFLIPCFFVYWMITNRGAFVVERVHHWCDDLSRCAWFVRGWHHQSQLRLSQVCWRPCPSHILNVFRKDFKTGTSRTDLQQCISDVWNNSERCVFMAIPFQTPPSRWDVSSVRPFLANLHCSPVNNSILTALLTWMEWMKAHSL